MWLRDALAAEEGGSDCPPLTGRESADVVIVGGGYTGLWTALELRDREPGLDIAIVEADICGGGASGRNGGFVLSWWPKLETLVEMFGEEEGLRLAWASDGAVHDIGTFCTANDVDAHYVHRGWLWVATSRAQVGAWEGSVRACERYGLDAFRRLSDDEIAARTGSPVTLAGVLEPNAATVQPALLARGMRRVELDRAQTAEAARRMRSIYPMIADVPVEHEWSGWVDRSVNGLPVFGHLPGSPHIVYGIGFSGNGVGPSRVGGRILASLARGREDEWSTCGLVADRHPKFPPEPARYLGSVLVRAAVARKERAEDEDRQPGPPSVRLAGFAPSGYFKISKG